MKKFKFKKFLIFPKIQIKYTAIYTCVTLVPILFLIAVQLYFLNQMSQIGITKEEMDLNIETSILFSGFVFIITAIVVVLTSIFITHRFLGPFIAIKRGLDSYRIEKKFQSIKIRKTDEAHVLVEQINKFFSDMEMK